MGTQTECICEADDVYALSATDKNGNEAMLAAYYTDEESMPDKETEIVFENHNNRVELYLLDETNDMILHKTADENKINVTMKPNTVIYVKNIV